MRTWIEGRSDIGNPLLAGGGRLVPGACRQFVVEPSELRDEVVESLGDFLASLIQVADLVVLGPDELIAIDDLREQRRDLVLRPSVAIDERGDGFFQPLEVVNGRIGNRPPLSDEVESTDTRGRASRTNARFQRF
jgi:hypothetical protein